MSGTGAETAGRLRTAAAGRRLGQDRALEMSETGAGTAADCGGRWSRDREDSSSQAEQ